MLSTVQRNAQQQRQRLGEGGVSCGEAREKFVADAAAMAATVVVAAAAGG